MKDLTSEKQGRPSTIQDKSGKCLNEEQEILSRWTEYFPELHNYESCGDNFDLWILLDCSQPPENLQPILHEEVKIAVASLKKGKSAGVDNIPEELVQAGGETMIDVFTHICNRIWRTTEWPTPWTQSLIITLPIKGNLQRCQNYRTISLISFSSKVMMKVILNRLKPHAEEIIAEEQARFRAGRSTTEHIFNLIILCENYLQHQQNLYHVFPDFQKAFDRVWHAALWAIIRKYNISANLVRTIGQLYDKATSAVQLNGSIGAWFRTTVGVRQGCLLSLILVNIVLKRIMSDALEEHDGKVSIMRQKYYQSAVCRWHRCSSWGQAGAGRPSRISRQNLHKVYDGDECREDQTVDKQRQWYPERDKGKRAEAGHCNKLQVLWSSCFRWWLQTRGSLNDCTSHCSSYKAEAHLDR